MLAREYLCLTVLCLFVASLSCLRADDVDSSVSRLKEEQERKEQEAKWKAVITDMSSRIEASPNLLAAYSRRGDAYFFLQDFKKATADYEKMLELDPTLEASHWRLGLAYYYIGKYQPSARQFELYHENISDTDRENGIWRFLAQAEEKDVKTAREQLLDYKKRDRTPLTEVYEMFQDKLSPEEFLKWLQEENEREPAQADQRTFYGELYAGLYLKAIGEERAAHKHFGSAAKSDWPDKAGYGPQYMQRIAEIEYALTADKANTRFEKVRD